MLLFINLSIILFVPLILGLVVLTAILQKKTENFYFWEKLALAFAVGWGAHIIIMFLLSLAKIPLTFINILAADFTVVIAGLTGSLRQYRRGFQIPGFRALFGWPVVLFAIIGLKALFVAWSSFIKPVIDPDILNCYALGAKTIFMNKTFLGAWGVGDKPLLPFLSQAWPVIGINSWNDALLTLSHPFMFLSFLIIFYAVLRRSFGRFYSIFFTFILSSIPFLVFHAGTAYTDFPQAFYYSIATFYLFLFIKEFDHAKEPAAGYLVVSALLLGISVWAKKSGLYYAGINIAVLTLFLLINLKKIKKSDLKTLAWSALLFILIVFPWLAHHQFYTFKGFYAEATTSIPQHLLEFKSQGLSQALLRNTFFEDNWHLLGMLLLSVLLLYPRKAFSPPNIFLFAIIGAQLVMLFILFRFTNLQQCVFNETLLNRLTLHFSPVILYFCAEVIGSKIK